MLLLFVVRLYHLGQRSILAVQLAQFFYLEVLAVYYVSVCAVQFVKGVFLLLATVYSVHSFVCQFLEVASVKRVLVGIRCFYFRKLGLQFVYRIRRLTEYLYQRGYCQYRPS